MIKLLKTPIVDPLVINDLTLPPACLLLLQILEASHPLFQRRILSLSYLDESLLEEGHRDRSNSLSNQKDLDLKLSSRSIKILLTNLLKKEDNSFFKK